MDKEMVHARVCMFVFEKGDDELTLVQRHDVGHHVWVWIIEALVESIARHQAAHKPIVKADEEETQRRQQRHR
jgi:hypothetical protein